MERELPFAPKIASNKEKTKNPITTTKALALTVKTTMWRKTRRKDDNVGGYFSLNFGYDSVIGVFGQPVEGGFFNPVQGNY